MYGMLIHSYRTHLPTCTPAHLPTHHHHFQPLSNMGNEMFDVCCDNIDDMVVDLFF
jgi:hypothetical protein